MNKELLAKIQNQIGNNVTVENRAHEDGDESAMQVYIHGKLYASDEHNDLWFVRIAEGYDGASSIQFMLRHVLDFSKQPSGRIVITIR